MEKEWLVFYDGYCNLCSRTVQWIIRNDRRKRFSFMPLQEAEPGFFKHPDTETRSNMFPEGDTVLLRIHGKVYARSEAALRIACHLRFPWPLLGLFLVVPRFLRDPVYDLVARNRKKWFGERSTCYRP